MVENEMNEIADALRKLVACIYNDCVGAYGAEDSGYEGQYEKEIQAVAKAIKRESDPRLRSMK